MGMFKRLVQKVRHFSEIHMICISATRILTATNHVLIIIQSYFHQVDPLINLMVLLIIIMLEPD